MKKMTRSKIWAGTFAVVGVLIAGTGCTQRYTDAIEARDQQIRTQHEELLSLQADRDAAEAMAGHLESELGEERSRRTVAEGSLAALEMEAEVQPASFGGSEDFTPVVLTLPSSVTFDSGKATLSSAGKKSVRTLSASLKAEYAGRPFTIVGHTDSTPIKKSGFKDNMELSLRRAEAVQRFLAAECGVSPSRITVSGAGEFSPVADNATAEGRGRNRRVEITIR